MPKAAVLAFLASPFVMSAAEAPAPTYVNVPQVVQVLCSGGRGTAWRYGSHGIISVNHVTEMTGCSINGEPIDVTFADREKDFSSLRSTIAAQGLEIDCGGYRDGTAYLAVGFANGIPIQRAMVVVASDRLTEVASWKGFYTLYGDERFIPGMSGGIVATKDGKVVGLVNAYNVNFPLSYSRPLSETPLCAGRG